MNQVYTRRYLSHTYVEEPLIIRDHVSNNGEFLINWGIVHSPSLIEKDKRWRQLQHGQSINVKKEAVKSKKGRLNKKLWEFNRIYKCNLQKAFQVVFTNYSLILRWLSIPNYVPATIWTMLTLSLDIKVGPKIMAILGTPILLTLTSSVTLKRKKKINNQY